MSRSSKRPTAAASVAGAGGGTGLLGLANLIPDSYPAIKSLAIYASPSVGIGITIFGTFVLAEIRTRMRRKEMHRALTEARLMRDAVMADKSASAAHKKRVQKNVENLEILAFELVNDETETVRATLKDIK